MANAPLATPTPPAARLRDRGGAFAFFAAIDDGYYGLERIVVTTALLVMSLVSALNILFQFLIRLRSAWFAASSGDGSWMGLLPGLIFLGAIYAIGVAIARAAPSLRQVPQLAPVFGVMLTVAVSVLCALMLVSSSAVVLSLLTAICAALVVVAQLDTPRPLGTPAWNPRSVARVGVAVVLGGAGVVVASQVPEGYSWAQKISLVLLLWVAFIGASMATHDGRHLSVDAIRKAVPPKALPWFNAASYLVAATFTVGFAYLSFIYLERRLDETANPGEIPDWIKVLAIPFSLALVSIRFAGQAIASMLGAVLLPAPGATREG